jgi:hypothetical protein
MRVEVDYNNAALKVEKAVRVDNQMRTYANAQLERYCAPYVPMQTGTLSQSVTVSPDCVQYHTPYARYQYNGVVYEPSIPIMQGGVVVGFFSPPGQPKRPTGRAINYSRSYHPLAQAFWDKGAMAAHLNDLLDDVAQYIRTRAAMEG